MKFTKEEKIALIFVITSLFLGIAAIAFKNMRPQAGDVIKFNWKEAEASKKINPALACKGGVNINEASLGELIKLNRVGPALAERIISYRKKYGPFKRPEEIKNIKGIGEKTYEKMKEQIILE